MGELQPESDLVVSCILVDAAGGVLDARDLHRRRSATGVILYARDTGRALLCFNVSRHPLPIMLRVQKLADEAIEERTRRMTPSFTTLQ
jgi:hypothetical protein